MRFDIVKVWSVDLFASQNRLDVGLGAIVGLRNRLGGTDAWEA
jgi:hypothetical protein